MTGENGTELEYDKVVLAAPAFRAAELSSLLSLIPFVNVALVGFLVPSITIPY